MEPPNPFTAKVFDKLAQLKQWQSEQHERLIREQEEQRRVLLDEQNNRMQNLGIDNIGEEMTAELREHHGDDLHGVSILSSDSESACSSEHHTVTLNTTAEESFDRTFETNDDYEETHPKMLYVEITKEKEMPTSSHELGENGKRKFTFLRRGEGLSRFRMTPRDIMLQNKRIQATKGKSGSNKVVNQPNVKQGKSKVVGDKRMGKANGKTTKSVVNVQAKPVEVKSQGKRKAANKAPVVTSEGKMMVPRSPSLPTLSLDTNAPSTSRQHPPPNLPTRRPSQPSVSNWVANTAQYVPSSQSNMAYYDPPISTASNRTTIRSMQAANLNVPVTMSHVISDIPSVSHYVSNLASNMMAMPSSVTDTSRDDSAVCIPNSQVRVNSSYMLDPEQFMVAVPVVMPLSQHNAAEDGRWVANPMVGSSWSTMLSQAQVNAATNVAADSSRVLEQRELRTFERLERIAADSSFCSSSSLVTRFVEGGYLSSSVQSTPQVTPMKQHPRDLQLPETSTPNPTIDNAKALIKRLAAINFTEQPHGPKSSDVITLDLRPLEGQQIEDKEEETHIPHVRFQDNPQIHEVEVESEAWSASDEDTSEETDSESGQTSSETEETQQSSDQAEGEKLAIGCLVHTRLEELQQELLKVQQQQTALTKQREELAEERQRLATIISQTEEEKRRLEIDRKNFNMTTRKKQQQDKEQVEQLKKQLSEMESSWKDREARWAASQASQRAQLRQISLENKELSLQISCLKASQAKKVQFSNSQKRPEVKIIRRSIDGKVTTTSSSNKKSCHPEVSSYFASNPTMPTVSAMRYGNANATPEDSYHVVNSPNVSPGGKISTQATLPAEEDLSVSQLDVDTMVAKYKRLFGEDPTPYSSLVLDSPGGISAAYNAIFNNNDESTFNLTANDTSVQSLEPSRRYNELISNNGQNNQGQGENQPQISRPNHTIQQDSGQNNIQRANTQIQTQVLSQMLSQNQSAQITNNQVQNQYRNPIFDQNLGQNVVAQQVNIPHQNVIENQMLTQMLRQNQQANSQVQNPIMNPVLAQNLGQNVVAQQVNIPHQNLIENQMYAQMLRQSQLTRQAQNVVENQTQRPNIQNFAQNQNSVENPLLAQMLQQNQMAQHPNRQFQNSVAVQTSFLIGQVQGTYQDPVNYTTNPTRFNTPTAVTQNSAVSDLQRVIRNSDFIRLNAENRGYVKHGSAVTGVSASGDAHRAYAPRNSELTAMEIQNLGYKQPRIDGSDDMILRGIVRYAPIDNETMGVQETIPKSRMEISASGDNAGGNNYPEIPTAAAAPNPGVFTASKKSQSTGFYKISTQFSEISIVSAVEESSSYQVQSTEVVESEANANAVCEQIPVPVDSSSDENGGASCVVYLEDGSRRLWFPNGNTMTINADNTTMTLYFYNGDIQETVRMENQIRYYYAARQVWETNYLDGTTVLTFPDGQHHKIYPSGRKEIRLADDSMMTVFEDGRKETVYPNGAKNIQQVDGTVLIYHPDGMKETRNTDKTTRLDLPDGTVITGYPSGLEETRYTSGRTVVKDSTGKVLLDSARQYQ